MPTIEDLKSRWSGHPLAKWGLLLIFVIGLLAAWFYYKLYWHRVSWSATVPEECNCYWSGDCGPQGACLIGTIYNHPKCLSLNKLDGVCFGTEYTLNPFLRDIFGRYVDSMISEFQNSPPDTGRISVEKLKQLKAAMTADGLSEEDHERIRLTTLQTLDAMVGYDFRADTGPPYLGVVLRMSPTTTEAIEYGKQAVKMAIASDNIASVEAPIRAFWQKHPGYRPNHVGRCFPHGHDEVKSDADAAECQITELKRTLSSLWRIRGK